MTTTHNRTQSETIEVTESAGVAAFRCLAFAGDYPADDTVAIYGVTRTAAKDDELVTVDVMGRLEIEASAAIAVGASVSAGNDGRIATTSGNNKFIVGYCVKAASGAGKIAEIQRGI